MDEPLCQSVNDVPLSTFVRGFSILLATVWALVGTGLFFVLIRLVRVRQRSVALLALSAVLYCACKCASFSADVGFVLVTPGLIFDQVARLLGALQLLFFSVVGASLLESPPHAASLKRVVVLIVILVIAHAVLIAVASAFFDLFQDPGNQGFIAVLFLTDFCDLLVAAVALFGALLCARAARAGLLAPIAQFNIKWHHRFTLFGAFFCFSRVFAALVSVVLFALLLAERDRAPLRGSIELGALFAFIVEIVPLIFLTRVLASAPLPAVARQSASSPLQRRWKQLRDRLRSQSVITVFLVLTTVTLAVWGMHSSCSLDAAPLGGGLAAARAGAVPLYFLIPLTFLPVLYGFVSFLEAASFGSFFPRDAGDSIALHKLLAGLTSACAVIHIAGHFSLLHAFEVFPDKNALTPAIVGYFEGIETQRRGIWMLPWITGFLLVVLFVLLWLSYGCCRQRGNAPLFIVVHRVGAYGSLVLVAVHGAGAILKPFPYAWIGVVVAFIIVAVDAIVRRRLAHDVEVELRLCVTLNEESQAIERVVIAQLRDELPNVVAGSYAGVSFPSLNSDDTHPFTVVWSRAGLHAFHIACTPRWRSWTNELARVAVSTPPPLLPRLRATVCAAFRSEIADPAFLRAANVVMVGLGTGATPFIGVADAVAAARVRQLRSRLRALTKRDFVEVEPDQIGFESADTSNSDDELAASESDADDADVPQLAFCHRSERSVLMGRVVAVDGDRTSALVKVSADWAGLWQLGTVLARTPVDVRLASRDVCVLSSSDVGRTHDGRIELFDVALREELSAEATLELVEAASGRVLLKNVRPTSRVSAGPKIDLILKDTQIADWLLLAVAPGVRLVLRTLARAVAEITADGVETAEPSRVRVRFEGAVAGLGLLLTVCPHDPVRVRQTRTLRTAVASASGAAVVTQLTFLDWRDVCSESDEGDVAVDVVIEGETVLAAGAAAQVCSGRGGALQVQLGAPHARAVAGAAVELRLVRNVDARAARRLTDERELVIDNLAPLPKQWLLDAAWARELFVAGQPTGSMVGGVEPLPRLPTAVKLRFARQRAQLVVGDSVALHTLGAYAQHVAIGASRLRNGLCTHVDRKAFWRVVQQRITAAVTSARGGSVHVGFCGARTALAQLHQLIDEARSEHGRPVELFAEVFG